MIILASNSPRRRQIMAEWGYDFKVVTSDIDETLSESLTAEETVKILSQKKAQSVFDTVKDSNAIVIGADTVVAFNGKILGKPANKIDAEKMLTELSGKEHFVYTGFTVISKDKVVTESVKSVVKFNNLTKDFIQKYIATGSPLDKAGAYGIQDDGVVENYQGSYFNIVGLPIERLAQILATFGVTGKK